MAEGIGVVRIFLASGNGPDPVLESILWRKADATRIARLGQRGRQRTRETELLLDIFAQEETGIGRPSAPLAVERNGFAPNRGQAQRCRGTLSPQSSVRRIAT